MPTKNTALKTKRAPETTTEQITKQLRAAVSEISVNHAEHVAARGKEFLAFDVSLAIAARAAVLENVFDVFEAHTNTSELLHPEQFWHGLRVIVDDIRKDASTLGTLAEEGWRR